MEIYSASFIFVIISSISILGMSWKISTEPDILMDLNHSNLSCRDYIELATLILDKKPSPSKKVRAKFTLYTRGTNAGETLKIKNISSKPFAAEKDTKIIIHGFLGQSRNHWVERLAKSILSKRDVNVIAVDWSNAAAFPYTRAVLNTPIVGLQVANLVNALIETRGGNASKFHIIGHSLGAHIAGYAGEKIPKLGRISGLDPAGPLFNGNEPHDRLDPEDADFVDVIHTNSECFGTDQTCGHIDFYPNGGEVQPGCSTAILPSKGIISGFVDVAESALCSHFRTVELFTESVLTRRKECQFKALRCNSYEHFLSGQCDIKSQEKKKIAIMGMKAVKYRKRYKSSRKPRKFFLITNSVSSFCVPQDFYKKRSYSTG